MAFEVGDRVRMKLPYASQNALVVQAAQDGVIGTVVGLGTVVRVCWDRYIDGHDCGGACEMGYGWNFFSDKLELVDGEGIELADINDESFGAILSF